jgi:hypothetical protein
MALVGLALMFFPMQFGRGAVPADAAPELLALLRLLGGPFLGIAVLNWLSRNAEPSTLRVVMLANIVGFGAVAANDIWGVVSGEARDIAKLFLAIHIPACGRNIKVLQRKRSYQFHPRWRAQIPPHLRSPSIRYAGPPRQKFAVVGGAAFGGIRRSYQCISLRPPMP